MKEFPIIDAADQQFGTRMNDQRVTIRLRYNVTSERWSFDLSIDDLPVIHGRRVVTGVDLLKPFNLNLGMLFALPADSKAHVEPDRTNLPDGTVKLYHATEEEFAAVVALENAA